MSNTYVIASIHDGRRLYVAPRSGSCWTYWTKSPRRAKRYPDLESIERFRTEEMTEFIWQVHACFPMRLDDAFITNVMEA